MTDYRNRLKRLVAEIGDDRAKKTETYIAILYDYHEGLLTRDRVKTLLRELGVAKEEIPTILDRVAGRIRT